MRESDRPTEPDAEDVLSSLPRARPQRRSSKRDGPPRSVKAEEPADRPPRPRAAPRKRTAATSTPPRPSSARATKPAGVRPSAATHKARGAPEPPLRETRPPASGIELVGTAVQAAGELAHLGLSVGARALRTLASRMPRP